MTTQPPEAFISSKLYEQDFYLWIETTVKQLRERNLENLDWNNLIEEIESMGKDKKRELKSRLKLVLTHLLKWKYQPGMHIWYGNSWINTITEQRTEIEFLLEDSPSLKPYLNEIFADCYAKARRDASKETGLSLDIFPVLSPFTLEETLSSDYF